MGQYTAEDRDIVAENIKNMEADLAKLLIPSAFRRPYKVSAKALRRYNGVFSILLKYRVIVGTPESRKDDDTHE